MLRFAGTLRALVSFRVAPVAAICALLCGSTLALAGTVAPIDLTCADLDSRLGGAPYSVDLHSFYLNITLAEGDVLAVAGSGTMEMQAYNAPAAGVTLPTTFTVAAANVGVWLIDYSPNTVGDTTFTCTSASVSTESLNLDQQQAAFSSLAMLHHAQTMTTAVAEETGNNGSGGGQNVISANGFFFSTRASPVEPAIGHLSAYGDEDPAPPVHVDAPWNLWIRGRYSHYDGDHSSFDGHIGDVFVGADYRVNEALTLGLLAGYNDTRFDTLTAGIAGAFDASGLTLGGYTNLALGGEVRLSGLAAYTRSSYEDRSGATTGSFDADRLTLSAELSGSYQAGAFTIVPAASVLWASEDQGGYVDSASMVHASRTISALRLSAGPKILFPEQVCNIGTYRFWFAARAEYDDANSAAAPSSGLPDVGNGASGRLSVGMNFAAANNASLELRGDVFGLGSGDYVAMGGSVKYRVSF